MCILRREWFLGVVMLSALPCLGDAMVPPEATQSFLDSNPGLRAMLHAERTVALYGVPMGTDDDPATDTDAFVAAFLNAHTDKLGVEGLVLELKDSISISNNKYKVYTYFQKIEALEVHGSVVKIPVLQGSTEKISYVGMHLVQTPEGSLPDDVLSDSDAVTVVQESEEYAGLTDFSTPEMVVFEASNASLHRAWRFSGTGEDGSYLFFVDTNSGDIVGAIDQIFEVDVNVSGTVTGYGTLCCHPESPNWPECCPSGQPDCCCLPDDPDYPACAAPCCGADSESNPPVEMALPGALVTLLTGGDTQVCPADGGTFIDELYTATDGTYDFIQVPEPEQVLGTLKGQWIRVVDCLGLQRYACEGEVLELIKTPATECALFTSESSPVDLVFNASQTEDETALVNAFVNMQVTHDWFKSLQPTFGAIDRDVPCAVNVSMPNAGYASTNEIFLIGQSAPPFANNFACSTVLSHEYGHFVLDQLLELGGSLEENAFHEGVADVTSSLMWDTQYMGEGILIDHTPSWMRDLDYDVQLNACDPLHPLPPWCPFCDLPWRPHCPGLALGGAFWDLRKDIGDSATERLFADFLFITDGRLDQSVLVELLIADDDDGDLSTPSQYQADIEAAFEVHGWHGPDCQSVGGTVNVKWDGPPAGVDPVEDQDYFLYDNVCPPVVVLRTTEVTYEGEDFDVWRYRLGRVDGGGNALDLGVLRAEWNGPAYDIRVEVGSDVDPDLKCKNLHIVDVAAQDSSTWSSIRLNLEGDLVGRAQCHANDTGVGGRISGTIAGKADRVLAEAIGIAESDAGTLDVGSSLTEVTLGTIPLESVLVVGEVGDSIDIRGELDGTVHIRGDLSGLVQLDVSGPGTSSGDILVDGEIRGLVTINGIFDGDICGSNLSADEPLPSRINLTPGPNATICLVRPLVTPSFPPAPHDARKNRYISIDPNNVVPVAIEVKLTSMKRCSNDLARACKDEDDCGGQNCVEHPDVGNCSVDGLSCTEDPDCVQTPEAQTCKRVIKWVGEPWDPCWDPTPCKCVCNGNADPPDPNCALYPEHNDQYCVIPGVEYMARLVDTAEYRTWTETTVHVGDCEIIPVATYEVRVTPDEVVFSDPLEIGTIEKPGAWHYGDVVGTANGELWPAVGWAPPDGVVSVNDVQAFILTMQGPSSPSAPVTWVDLHGLGVKSCSVSPTPCSVDQDCPSGQSCIFPPGSPPNYILNVSDLQRILWGLERDTWLYYAARVDPGCCPTAQNPDPCGVSSGEGGGMAATFTLVPTTDIISSAESVDVDVYVDSVDDLGAFELDLEVTGGTSGQLTLASITVDSARQDYVFFGEVSTHSGVNTDKGSFSHALQGDGVPVTGSGYLATYTYQPVGGASGVFTITVKGGEASFLNKGNGVMVPTLTGATQVIGVGIDCFDDADCSAIACQTATCNNYACIYTNLAQGTPCDDGQYCTETDECDGNGTCVGSGTPCPPPRNPQCCEGTDQCICSTCMCPQ